MNTLGTFEIARGLGAPVQAVDAIVRLGITNREILSIGDGLLYTPGQIESIKQRIREASAGRPFTPKQFRETFGTTRRYCDAILDYFDEIEFTVRTDGGRACRD